MARTPTIRPEREKVAADLRILEDRYRHEFMDADERLELRERILPHAPAAELRPLQA